MTNYLRGSMQVYESDFLELRQRMKESIRNRMHSGDTYVASTSEQRKRKLPYNDFGSFFGPSQPVIASRVLRETKSLLENEQAAAKLLNSIQDKITSVSTSGSGTNNANEVKRKAEILKDARDYSFLFSDDAELPVSIKEPPSWNGLKPNSKPPSSGSQIHPKPNGQAHTRKDSAIKSLKQKPIKYNNDQPSSRLGSQRPVDHKRKLCLQRPPSSSKPLKSVPRQQKVEQRNVSIELKRSQLVRKPPLERVHQLKNKKKKKKKKKKLAKMSSEDDLALQMVRQMCKSDRYAGRDLEEDYDDRCMEANFDDIMREEKRSEKLGKKEDAEQLRLIEQEERRERSGRKDKKQKLSH